jgi:DNA-binding MarR family transcriptional regulator
MTGLIDTLERGKMVTRKPDPADRRQFCVELTSRGIAFLDKILPEHFGRIARLMEALSESERRTMVRLLGKIADRAADKFPRSEPSPAAPNRPV